jgi:hypothetical protein
MDEDIYIVLFTIDVDILDILCKSAICNISESGLMWRQCYSDRYILPGKVAPSAALALQLNPSLEAESVK